MLPRRNPGSTPSCLLLNGLECGLLIRWELLAACRGKALGIGLLSEGYSSLDLEHAGAYRVHNDPADLLTHLEELSLPAD